VIDPLDTDSAIWYNIPIMERFQRAKLERQISDVRRELWSWIAIYQTIVSDENRYRYDSKQLQLASERANYLEYVVTIAERLEQLLTKQSMP
jgi:hypothetical protein